MDSTFPVFKGRSLNTIFLNKSQAPVRRRGVKKTVNIFFKELVVKKNKVSGMMSKKLIPFSLDNRARKNEMPPAIKKIFELVKAFFRKNQRDPRPNRKQRISSRLF